MSDTMRAVVLTRFGGPDAFEVRTLPVGPMGARQVRVRVTAINPLDYQTRRGDYAEYVPLPAVIGHDISGVIEAVGADVTEFAPGDEVYYTPKIFGGAASYAEVHVADVDLVGRKPGNISHVEAASLTLVGGTVWEAFVIRAQLQVGETILIHGGAGGVGTVAIQVAKAIGARVVTTALARDHDFVRTLGADDAIDFTATDYVDAVNALTGERRVDVIAFKRKAVSIHHELMFTRSIYGKPDMAEQGRILNEASALVDAGRLRTTLTERLSPINAANLRRVHALLESGNARGKIVLEGFQSG